MGCTLMARIAGRGSSPTWSSKTKETPACPQCGTRSWIDPTSFTAFYRNLSPNVHTCVFGAHEDPSVTHVVLDPTIPPPAADGRALVITQLSAGLCTEHLAVVRAVGIGTFQVSSSRI